MRKDGLMRMRRNRLKDHSINRLIPNMLTLFALCAGLTSIRFAMEQRWEFAVLAILFAAVFDALDGRIARLLDASSKFGAELDSLSDFVSFGVAPAILAFTATATSGEVTFGSHLISSNTESRMSSSVLTCLVATAISNFSILFRPVIPAALTRARCANATARRNFRFPACKLGANTFLSD